MLSCFSLEPEVKCKVNAGTARFFNNDTSQFINVAIPTFPITTPISLNRNVGQTTGHVTLTSNGLLLGRVGDPKTTWQVSFTSILFANGAFPPFGFAAVNVFVALNGEVGTDLSQNNLLASVVFLDSTAVPQVAQGSGLLIDIPGGTQISLVAAMSGSPPGTVINLVEPAWSIDASQVAPVASLGRDKCSKSSAFLC